MTTVLFLVVAVAGLLLPGYLLGRWLGLERSWLVAFPFSVLLLVVLATGLTVVGWPLRFDGMALLLTGVAVVLALAARCRKNPVASPASAVDRSTDRQLHRLVLGIAAVIALLVGFRAVLFPVSGFDTYFRWEGLARAMLQEQSLTFYPPLAAADFAIYVFPDGMPPLVASVYWWLYAALGRAIPEATAVSVLLQLLTMFALVYYGADLLFGRLAASFALLAAATSTLLVSGFAIGQETGFTALSVAGQLYFAGLATRAPNARLIVAAALFAAIGSWAREYGPALGLAGLAMLVWTPHTRRHVWLFMAVTVVASAPWYLRSWLLAGNPLYPHAIPGGFAHNDVYAEMLRFYQKYRSVADFSGSEWWRVVGLLASGSALAVFFGIPAALRRWRETLPLIITAVVVVVLWLYSVGQTAGGIAYSLRVLTPVMVIFALLAGNGLDHFSQLVATRHRIFRLMLVTVVLACGAYAGVSAAAHPFPARSVVQAFLSRSSDPPEFCVVQPELVQGLLDRNLKPTRVLTDDMYFATLLKRRTLHRPVVIWSPEVRFIFDPRLSAEEVRQRLLALGVELVVIENDSPNTLFLMDYPFYRNYRSWSLLLTVIDHAAIFALR